MRLFREEITKAMSENLHSSLPIEYQLSYGTAKGNFDLAQLVNNTSLFCDSSSQIAFPKEKTLSVIGSDSSPLAVNGLDSLLVSLD